VSVPEETAHGPLLELIVKLETVPEKDMVAGVCVLQVPPVKMPPVLEPETTTLRVLLEGSVPGEPVGDEPGDEVEEVGDPPLFGT